MNAEIKRILKERGIAQWKVARKMGVGETTLCRWLRDELDEKRRKAIFSAIEALSGEGV